MSRRRDPNKPKRNPWKEPSRYGTFEGPRGDADQWRAAFGEAWQSSTAVKVLKDESPWDIIGVPAGSAWATIKSAFGKLIKIHHPDKGGTKEMAQKIIAAYEKLKEGFE